MDMNLKFNQFFAKNVTLSQEETKRNLEIVMPLLKDILTEVHKMDYRFKIQPLNIGSYYTQLKVSSANEFDYSVVLATPTLYRVPPCFGVLNWLRLYCNPLIERENTNNTTPKQQDDVKTTSIIQTHITLPEPPEGKCLIHVGHYVAEWSRGGFNFGDKCLTLQEYLIPIKVKRRFKFLVSEAIKNPYISKFVTAKKLSDSPAITLSINNPNISPKGGTITVDLAPLVECRLPFSVQMGWPRSDAKWPSKDKIMKIQSVGVNAVAKEYFYWTYSYASCEKELLDSIDANGTCRKKSHRIMKKLKEYWCPLHMKQELTSYHLKNVLFWECEEYSDDIEWSNEHLSDRITSMCDRIILYIQKEKLPLYFHVGVNLFENNDIAVLKQVKENIQNFLKDPGTILG